VKILIADDDPTSLKLLNSMLSKMDHEIIAVQNGRDAFDELSKNGSPKIAILDWIMPEMDGVEVCKKIKSNNNKLPAYIILLTVKDSKRDIINGLDAGADDYIIKPYDQDELRARVDVGNRVIQLQMKLEKRVNELEEALEHIKSLQSVLPICSYCKKIRDDKDYWEQLEAYFEKHSKMKFSHSICPECFENVVKPELDKD